MSCLSEDDVLHSKGHFPQNYSLVRAPGLKVPSPSDCTAIRSEDAAAVTRGLPSHQYIPSNTVYTVLAAATGHVATLWPVKCWRSWEVELPGKLLTRHWLHSCLWVSEELLRPSCKPVSEEQLTGLPGPGKAYHWPALT